MTNYPDFKNKGPGECVFCGEVRDDVGSVRFNDTIYYVCSACGETVTWGEVRERANMDPMLRAIAQAGDRQQDSNL